MDRNDSSTKFGNAFLSNREACPLGTTVTWHF